MAWVGGGVGFALGAMGAMSSLGQDLRAAFAAASGSIVNQGTLRDASDAVAYAQNIIHASRTRHPASACMLGTVLTDEDGVPKPRMRPINPMQVELTGARPHVLFNTNTKSRKFQQLSENRNASLVYLDADGIGYVNLIGTAERLPPDEALQHWETRQLAFYPEGHDEGRGRFSVWRLTPTRMELISMRLGVDSASHSDWRPLACDWIDGTWVLDELTVPDNST